MLVFRNQTAYSRFWGGRCHLNTVTTAVRCISRQILALVPAPATPTAGLHSVDSQDSMNRMGTLRPSVSDLLPSSTEPCISKNGEAITIETVKILIAMLYTVKNHLRAEWGVALSPGVGYLQSSWMFQGPRDYPWSSDSRIVSQDYCFCPNEAIADCLVF